MYGEEEGKKSSPDPSDSSSDKFYAEAENEEKNPENLSEAAAGLNYGNDRGTLQIILISSIGMVSLLFLIVMRNTDFWNSGAESLSKSSLSAVSQLRDFLSGCIGFLLGYPVKK